MRRRQQAPPRPSDLIDRDSRAELYRIVGLVEVDADRERAVDDLARAVLDANALLDSERPRPTTAELVDECMDAAASHGGALVDDVHREARRRRLQELPEPVLRAFLVAFSPKRRRQLRVHSADLLMLRLKSWIGCDPRYLEILEELPGPHEDKSWSE